MSTFDTLSHPVYLCGIGWTRFLEKKAFLPGKNGGPPAMPQESLTGIKTRTVAEEHGVENLAEMAVRDLFSDHSDRLDTVEFLMMTSTSPGILLPATASIVGGRLFREKTVPCVDIGGSCSGSLVALSAGSALLCTGSVRNLLVVSAEKKTAQLCPTHGPETAGIFGDMGAAALLSDSPRGLHRWPPFRLKAIRIRSRGDLASLIWKEPDPCDGAPLIRMNGPRVFREAVSTLTGEVPDFLKGQGLSTSDIALAIFHQANGRLLGHVARKLGFPPKNVPLTLTEFGNTSSSSTLLTLAQALEERGRVDGPVLLATFGGGITWGLALLEPV
ncbi:3-oxoacyl-ACP synthase III family protein [Leptospirillum ferriphilum]|uniref:3-oxoacyl-ACP synthase III family protein n=1 Tax=Leptospirillum ferriphilum TaxID=178606 RepID=UPI00098411E9|nr:3-oxoacyl-[acyl-carrier-protein] synthase III C-terminal domain-containing protein [Leptospirillum ferriphilum]